MKIFLKCRCTSINEFTISTIFTKRNLASPTLIFIGHETPALEQSNSFAFFSTMNERQVVQQEFTSSISYSLYTIPMKSDKSFTCKSSKGISQLRKHKKPFVSTFLSHTQVRIHREGTYITKVNFCPCTLLLQLFQ